LKRREYLYLQFLGVIAFILAACGQKDKPEIKPEPVPIPKKKLTFIKIVPEIALAGSIIEVFWQSDNIYELSVFTKTNGDWELYTERIDAKTNSHKIQLPEIFEANTFFSIKLLGDQIDAVKENIVTANKALPKLIEIIRIEPNEAIAGEKLTLFFKTENIKTVLIELRNRKDELVEIGNADGIKRFYQLTLPKDFELNDELSIKLSGDGVIATKENIPTLNVLNFNIIDYPDLQETGGFQKISILKGDVWLKRISENEVKSFSGACTHSGCGIDYLKTDKLFYCSCHGSKFTSDGDVINGPANLPLSQYRCDFISDGKFKLIY